MAYTLNNGQVFVKAYIQPWTEAHIIRVSVNPGITFTPNGTANAAAMYTLQYSPQRHSMQWLAYGVGIAISYLITGAIAATIIACHLGVLVPAGDLLNLTQSYSLYTMTSDGFRDWFEYLRHKVIGQLFARCLGFHNCLYASLHDLVTDIV